MAFPEWVEKQKRQGCEIKCINGKYYMYERKSAYDPVRKKSKKVTGAYLGAVTPDGIVVPKKRIDKPILSLEHGATAFLAGLSTDLLSALYDHFDDDVAQRVWAMSLLRLVNECPFRRIDARYEASWMSRLLPSLSMSPPSITRLLDVVGGSRRACAGFMRSTMAPSEYLLVDGTGTVSRSCGMDGAMPGHSSKHGFLPQVNQIYVVSMSDGGAMPVFYRNAAGNVPDVTALELTLADAGIENATLVADAGFASGVNFGLLDEADIKYVIPLKRNTAEIDLGKTEYEELFTYHDRAISAHSEQKDGYRICVFRDEKMRAKEMGDFLGRKEKGNASAGLKKGFDPSKDLVDVSAAGIERLPTFGTIIFRTTVPGGNAKDIYALYKTRWEIEQLFDTLRNTLGADESYMQDDTGFEAWTFINHISLVIACRVLSLIRKKKKSKDISLAGLMDMLSHVHAVSVADEWRLAEIVGKTKTMLSDLGITLDLRADIVPKS
jgi:transposase